ncbi:MAG: hypothetical protein GKR89_04920 [Candidatus Latescibacteria bacterium]|nr:hypothetical protein [Candidatus Latescibacterota bacterium]
MARTFFLLILAATELWADVEVRYQVSFPADRQNDIDVVCTIPEFLGGDLTLRMRDIWARSVGIWRQVQDLEVETDDGRIVRHDLVLNPDNNWATVDLADLPKGRLVFRYTIEAKKNHSLVSEATRNADYCMTSGYALFLEMDRSQGIKDFWVDFDLPEGWTSVTNWGHGKSTYHPQTQASLQESKIALGDYRYLSDTSGDIPINLAIRGQWSFTDSRLHASLQKYARYFGAFFGETPDSSITLLVNKGLQGLDDGAATPAGLVAMTYGGGAATLDPARSDFYLNHWVLVHELFHIWNRQLLRAASDPWFHESINTYNAVVTIYRQWPRATEEERAAADEILRAHVSGWLTGEDAWGPSSLAALVLDAEIRRGSAGLRSMDDLLIAMYDQFGGDPPSRSYTREGLFEVASSLAGADMLWVNEEVISFTELQSPEFYAPYIDEFYAWLGQEQSITTTVEPAHETAVPVESSLVGNYPNPFNASTLITIDAQQTMPGRLLIYNAAGRRIRTLVAGLIDRGVHRIPWDGTDGSGRAVGTGVYIYALEFGGRRWSRPMMLLR